MAAPKKRKSSEGWMPFSQHPILRSRAPEAIESVLIINHNHEEEK
jgi:hypothetical protein